MHDNIEYGFDPHDDSDYLNIHDNTVYDNGNHGIIASKRCNDVSIQDNTVYGGSNAGLFLHRSSDNAIVRGKSSFILRRCTLHDIVRFQFPRTSFARKLTFERLLPQTCYNRCRLHCLTSVYARFAGNHVYNNDDAGLAMLESFNADVSDNIFEDNLYGVRMSVGCANNVISNNEIKGSGK